MRQFLTDVEESGPLQRGFLPTVAVAAAAIVFAVAWSLGSSNPFTPAGYVGYLTKGAVMGQSRFYGDAARPDLARPHVAARRDQRQRHAVHLHRGLLGDEAVLSRDNLKIAFQRPHRVARRREQGAAVHGSLQHDGRPQHAREGSGRDREGRLRATSSASRCAPSRATRCSGATAWR